MVLGLLIALAFPDYYPSVFPGIPADADPRQVGMGLGLAQGVLAGIAVALVLIVALAWWRVRSRQLEILLGELAEIRSQLAQVRRRLDQDGHPAPADR